MTDNIKVGTVGYPIVKKRVWPEVDVVELTDARELPPKTKTARKWRAEAPSSVSFIVQASRYLTERPDPKSKVPGDFEGYGEFKLTEENRQLWQRLLDFCEIMQSDSIMLLTPSSFSPARLSKMVRFFEEVNREKINIIWEPHGPWGQGQKVAVAKDLGFVLAVDPLRDEAPLGKSAYFRFGPFAALGSRMGIYDLEQIVGFAQPFEQVTCVFETVRALDDTRNLRKIIEEWDADFE